GAVYEYSTTSDTAKTDATGNIVSPGGSYAANYGFSALGLGFIGDLVISYSASIGKSKTTETQQGITTGYVLADDDILDAFSVDVGIDSRYKTPIFRTKSGQSS